MATLAAINTELVTLVQGALTAAGVTTAQVGSEWPAKDDLENAGRDSIPVVAIVHKMTAYQSRNMRYPHSVTDNPVGIQSTTSDFSIAPSQSVTITLSYASESSAVNVNDGVSCGFVNGNFNTATSCGAVSGDTLSSMATKLATAINAAAITGISASASGDVVTVSNSGPSGYHIYSNVGNTTTIAETVKWASRSMQINVWCGDLTTKFAIQQAIETLLSQIDDAQGFALPSTEWIELKFHGARPDDTTTDKDVYCDLYLFTVDHMVDVSIELWPILATNPQIS